MLPPQKKDVTLSTPKQKNDHTHNVGFLFCFPLSYLFTIILCLLTNKNYYFMKNYFLRCVSVLALFISCQSSLGAQKTVTPQMAIDVAKQLNSNSEYLYYYGKVPRVINDACGCHVTRTAFSSNPWLETKDNGK